MGRLRRSTMNNHRLARAASGVVEVDNEAVSHLGKTFDDRVELGRAHPDAAPVEGAVGPTRDNNRPPFGESGPIAVRPDAREPVEVGRRGSGYRRRPRNARA